MEVQLAMDWQRAEKRAEAKALTRHPMITTAARLPVHPPHSRRTPPEEMKPQCRQLLQYLREVGPITPLEAQERLGIGRLGARVWDLIHKYGWHVESRRVKVRTRFDSDVNVSQYRLADGRAAERAPSSGAISGSGVSTGSLAPDPPPGGEACHG